MFEIGAGYELSKVVGGPLFSISQLEAALGTRIARRSSTVWQEHCSECAMPSCYATCAFYRPRLDYKCRRLDGGVRLDSSDTHVSVPATVKFGKWARLLGYGPSGLHSITDVRRRELRVLALARLSDRSMLRGLAAPVRRRITNHMSRSEAWGTSDLGRLYMVVECHNPTNEMVSLVFSFGLLRDEGHGSGAETFKRRLDLKPGYSVTSIPASEFLSPNGIGSRFAMELSPSNEEEHPELTFGLVDIVELVTPLARPIAIKAEPNGTLPKLKCVVWDLDNTLWSGTLVEDGLDKLVLNQHVAAAIRALDAKGVLQSVASKNNPEDALEALRHFGLEDYFLFPQISWHPKSDAIRQLSSRLNIGTDTFAFVDDQDFERAEIAAALPEVLAATPTELESFLRIDRLDLPMTSEAAQRRSLYRAEGLRVEAQAVFGSDYEEFLRSCKMTAIVAKFAPANVERVYELVQRTNQLNISTYRYTHAELLALEDSEFLRAFTVTAADRFGSYGLVGFVVLDLRKNMVVDLMFSCRVQGKLVDDACITWLSEAMRQRGGESLSARYRANRKNAPARELLERLEFAAAGTEGDFQILRKSASGRSLASIRDVITVEVPDAIA